jgi:hypothetical protein
MKSSEKKLLKYFSELSEQQQQTLLQFAEFLSTREKSAVENNQPIPEPTLIERPETETVVGAIKRLTASYPMLDRSKLFNETSSLMTRHIMQGQEAREVIDELERLFDKHYQSITNQDPVETDSTNRENSE